MPNTELRKRRRRLDLEGTRSIVTAFLRMDSIEEISYPLPFVLQQLSFISPVVIYYFVSQLVGQSRDVGGDYFTFAIVGYAVTRVLQSALTGFGAHMQKAQSRGTFETLLVEPVPWLALPFAMNLWRLFLGVVSGAIILGFAILLGAEFHAAGIPGFILVMLLGLGATTAIGILSASLLVLAKRSTPVITVYTLAVSLLGGMLFPISLLPAWLRLFSWLIPHTYTIAAARNLLMTDSGTHIISTRAAVVALLVFNAIVFPTGLWLFSRSMQYARKLGMLSGY